MAKTERLVIKVLQADKSALQQIARAEGEAVSVVLRRLIRAEAQRRGLWDPVEKHSLQGSAMTYNDEPAGRQPGGQRAGLTRRRSVHPPTTTIRACGKVAGHVHGDEFVKSVAGSRHMLRRPRAWAVDVGSLADAERLGAQRVEIHDGDSGVVIEQGAKTGLPVIILVDLTSERVAGSAFTLLDELRLNYGHARQQATGWYRSSLTCGMLGMLLIAVGTATVFLGNKPVGMATAVVGVIIRSVAGLFYAQMRQANERIDADTTTLVEMQHLNNVIQMANAIDNPTARDKVKAETVRKALRVRKMTKAGK